MMGYNFEMEIEEELDESLPSISPRRSRKQWFLLGVVGILLVLASAAVSLLLHSEGDETLEIQVRPGDDDQNNTLAPAATLYSEWLRANVTKASGVMFQIVDQIPHDAKAFTQGLTYGDGKLYESTGLNGHSTVRILDPVTGTVNMSVSLSSDYFGEGMTLYKGKLIQITWQSKTGFVWDATNISNPPVQFSYKTTKDDEGWGITYDPDQNELIVSDGSSNLVFWDPDTYEIRRVVQVTRQNGNPATNLNELEFWRGRVLANVWYEDVILVIHPETGTVEKEYDLSALWPKSERPYGTDVLNGISISGDPDILYVTGKLWNRIYLVRLFP